MEIANSVPRFRIDADGTKHVAGYVLEEISRNTSLSDSEKLQAIADAYDIPTTELVGGLSLSAKHIIWPDNDINSPMSIKLRLVKHSRSGVYWDTMREILAHDCETLPMEHFKVWASVLSIPIVTRRRMAPYFRLALQAAGDPVVFAAIQDPPFGCNTEQFDAEFKTFDDFHTSSNRVIAMGHLISCGITIQDLKAMDTIVEIGGGIGDMADTIYKLGFTGKYIIYDFPEVARIVKWYHKQIEARHEPRNIEYTFNVDDLPRSADMCIATFSLGEMPIADRDKLTTRLTNMSTWMIAFSKHILGVDNVAYFNKFVKPYQLAGCDIKTTEILCMPWDFGSQYLTIRKVTT